MRVPRHSHGSGSNLCLLKLAPGTHLQLVGHRDSLGPGNKSMPSRRFEPVTISTPAECACHSSTMLHTQYTARRESVHKSSSQTHFCPRLKSKISSHNWKMSQSLSKDVSVFLLLCFLINGLIPMTQGSVCGGTLLLETGVIMSPQFPNPYPNNLDCTWIIKAKENQIIDLRFNRFDTEKTTTTCYDPVNVFDGDINHLNSRITLCGSVPQADLNKIKLRSNRNIFVVKFHSDSYESRPGFIATYWMHDCSPFSYGPDTCNNTCACGPQNSYHCDNVNGTCNCKVGWTSKNCSTDIDECQNSQHDMCPGENQDCVNTPGSYQCDCRRGLVKNATGHCQDPKQCMEKKCSYMCGVISTDPRTEVCYCPTGMRVDPHDDQTCVECDNMSYGKDCSLKCHCDLNRANKCEGVSGDCLCNPGWASPDCRNIDECQLNTSSNLCGLHGTCVDTLGTYDCSCNNHYEFLNGTCAKCGRELTEPKGYIYRKVGASDGSTLEQCYWTIRAPENHVISLHFNTFSMGTSGFVKLYSGNDSKTVVETVTYSNNNRIFRSTTNVMRIDDNFAKWGNMFNLTYWTHECENFTYGDRCENKCSCIEENTIKCDSLNGWCDCAKGWTGANCSLDINECVPCTSQCQRTPGCICAPCSYDTHCYNYPGTYECVCTAGLLNKTTGRCQACPPMTYSENCSKSCDCVENNTLSCDATHGTCKCKQGWQSHDCSVDVNECFSLFECPSEFSYCENLPGSYKCKCFPGLDMDINDKCEVNNNSYCNISHCPGKCVELTTDTIDTEMCYCELGYVFDGTRCAICTDFTYGMNCNSTCDCVRNNTKLCHYRTGQCFCKEQFQGSDCSIDVDECSLTNPTYCIDHKCINTIGGFRCDCSPGYRDDNHGQCYFEGCDFFLNDTMGEVKSLNYPRNYTNAKNCSWIIEVTEGHQITLDFLSFKVFPGCQDRLEIYDGLSAKDPLLQVFCNNITRNVKSTQNTLYLRFLTDRFNSDIGFSAFYYSYECLPFTYSENCSLPCNCNLENTDHCDKENGTCICKKGWKSHDCSVDVDECTEHPDYCEEFTNCKNLNGSFECHCFEGLEQDTTGYCYANNSCQNSSCPGTCVNMNSTFDEYVEQCYCTRGFELVNNDCKECTNMTYGHNCQSKCSCDPENTLHCHKITGKCFCKPGWTSDDCSTDIDECQTVKCDVRSNCVNKPGNYECQCIPGYVRAPNGYCVQEGCVKTFTNETGTLPSPNYPKLPEAEAVCYWTISAGEHKVIQLSFSAINFLYYTCGHDVITIYDGNNTKAPILEFSCSLQNAHSLVQNSPYISSSHEMLITFSTDHSQAFVASYTFLDCPDWTYTKTCSKQCICVPNNTLNCDKENGQCHCKPGWISANCSLDINECSNPTSCSDYTDCINFDGGYECKAKQGLQFLQSSGAVQVEPGAECTQRSCSHLCAKVTKDNKTVEECYCPSGTLLIGDKCQACNNLTYGPECAYTCPCVASNTDSCHVKTGACHCKRGWVGSDCSENYNDCKNWYCSDNTYCVDLLDDYECQCYSGYEKINDVCQYKGCEYNLSDPTGVILSPGYPSLYVDNAKCSWNISVDQGRVIELNFQNFDVPDCSHDYLDVYDGNNASAHKIIQLCNPVNLRVISSTTNSMLLTFTSDSWNKGRGFKILYNSFECPEWTYPFNCTIPCNCVRSNTKYCDRGTGRCVCEEGWTSEDCSQDVDECHHNPKACPDYSKCNNFGGGYECLCYDGLERISNTSCQVSPQMNCTENNCSHICAKVMTGIQTLVETCYCPIGTILVGNTCQRCPNLTYGPDCSLPCNCNPNNTASCHGHTGQCYCKEGWESSDCSQDVNECEYDCRSSNMRCVNTPGSHQCTCTYGHIFSAGYCIYDGCKRNLTTPTGYLDSPNYPNNYANSGHCSYTITVDHGSVISLSFIDLDLENSYKCTDDYIEIYDGPNTLYPMYGRFCGTLHTGTIRSTRNTMHVEFISNSYVTARGFSAHYVGHACLNYTFGETCSESCLCNQTNSLFCDNLSGVCVCKNGWMGFTCSEDIDECHVYGSSACTNHSQCVNKIGGFDCICQTGFFKNTTGQCQECNQGEYGADCLNVCQCSREGTLSCNNIDGTCLCKDGWKGSDCSVDINECNEKSIPCPIHTTCINTLGSYLCGCSQGYVKNNISGNCEDIDECINEQSPPCDQICINNDGGFRCSCVPGYQIDLIDGTKCTECEEGKFGKECSQTCQCNSENTIYCKKSDGTCMCKPGWSGTHCSDGKDSPIIG